TVVKSPNNVADKMSSLIERFGDRLTLENRRLSERYSKGELHILIRMRYRDSVDYIAFLQREGCGRIGLKDDGFFLSGVSASDSHAFRKSLNNFRRHAESRILESRREQG